MFMHPHLQLSFPLAVFWVAWAVALLVTGFLAEGAEPGSQQVQPASQSSNSVVHSSWLSRTLLLHEVKAEHAASSVCLGSVTLATGFGMITQFIKHIAATLTAAELHPWYAGGNVTHIGLTFFVLYSLSKKSV